MTSAGVPRVREYRVPVVLRIEADNPQIALSAAEQIAEGVAAVDRHLSIGVEIPGLFDPIPYMTCPDRRFDA